MGIFWFILPKLIEKKNALSLRTAPGFKGGIPLKPFFPMLKTFIARLLDPTMVLQLPNLDLGAYNFGPQVGTLAWLVNFILGLLIGPLALKLALKLFSKEEAYGKCFATWFLAEIVIIAASVVGILGTFLTPLILLAVSLFMVIFICCLYPKIISNRHNLDSWFRGLVTFILALIVNMILTWVLNLFIDIIPAITLFTIS